MIETIFKTAKLEAEWLRYYGHIDSRNEETFNDILFYDRMYPIGYSKKYTQLADRCPMGYLNGLNLKSNIEICFGPRNHSKEIYTCLEFIIHNKIDGYLNLIKIIKL
jgi:hypothetical protein